MTFTPRNKKILFSIRSDGMKEGFIATLYSVTSLASDVTPFPVLGNASTEFCDEQSGIQSELSGIRLLPHMERPADLKEEFYTYIFQRFTEIPETDMRALLRTYSYSFPDAFSLSEIEELVLEQPAAFLYYDYKLLSKPHSVKDTFIEFNDGQTDEHVTYLIDQTAAEAISLNQHSAILYRNLDGASFLVPIERIKMAFKNNCSIDYREMSTNEISAL